MAKLFQNYSWLGESLLWATYRADRTERSMVRHTRLLPATARVNPLLHSCLCLHGAQEGFTFTHEVCLRQWKKCEVLAVLQAGCRKQLAAYLSRKNRQHVSSNKMWLNCFKIIAGLWKACCGLHTARTVQSATWPGTLSCCQPQRAWSGRRKELSPDMRHASAASSQSVSNIYCFTGCRFHIKAVSVWETRTCVQ